MRLPDHKLREAAAYEAKGLTVFDDSIRDLVEVFSSKGASGPEQLREAYHIWEDENRRSYVEAYLLVCTPAQVAVSLDMSTDTVTVYRDNFFNVGVFKDRLAKIAYVSSLPETRAKDLKMSALTLGKEFLDWRIGNTINSAPDEILAKLLTDSYTMARVGMRSGNPGTKASREAFRWATLASRIADTLAKRQLAGPADAEDIFDTLQVIPVFDEVDDTVELMISPEQLVRG